MKAPDPCERWLWSNPEEIIERLIARSSRTIGLPVNPPAIRPTRDRYYRQAKRLHIRQALRTALRGAK